MYLEYINDSVDRLQMPAPISNLLTQTKLLPIT